MSGGAKSLVETYVMQSRLQQAQGDLDNAYRSLTQAERTYHLKASMLTRFRLQSQKARLNLEAGRLDEVIHWVRGLERARAESQSALDIPTIFHEVVQLILARVYLAKGEPENALLVLEHIQTPAETEERCKHVIEIYALKSLALQMLKRSQAALEHIEQALRLAEHEDFRRVFLDCAMDRADYRSPGFWKFVLPGSGECFIGDPIWGKIVASPGSRVTAWTLESGLSNLTDIE